MQPLDFDWEDVDDTDIQQRLCSSSHSTAMRLSHIFQQNKHDLTKHHDLNYQYLARHRSNDHCHKT